jgi:transcriptional regulator with XRE-family HTH domain
MMEAREMQLLLQETRDICGLQQEEVAQVFKRSRTWVSRIENGKRPLTLGDFLRFARLYQVHPWDLARFFRFPPPTSWPAPLCEACQARWSAALAAEGGGEACGNT